MHALVLAMSVLSGDRSTLQLDWSASEACPSEARVEAYVEQFLREGNHEHVVADAHIEDSRGGYALSLALSSPLSYEHHELWSENCEELSWIGALLIAGFIDPTAVSRPARDDAQQRRSELQVQKYEPLEPQRPRPPTRVQRPAQAAPRSRSSIPLDNELERSPAERLRGLVSEVPDRRRYRASPVVGTLFAGFGGHLGLFPGPGASARLGLGVDLGRLRLLAAARGWFGPGLEGSAKSGAVELGARLYAWSVESSVCGLPGWRTLYFPICLSTNGGQFGAMGGISTGQGQWSTDEFQAWASVGLEVGTEWWFAPQLALYASVGAAASLALPVFGLEFQESDGTTTTIEEFRVSVPYAHLHLGAAFRFGKIFRRNGARSGGQNN